MFKKLLLLFIFSIELYAAQFAYVMSDKAIVYSDMELKSPIGYIVKGKKIKIGEIARFQGTLYPTVVNGKVAYIESKDLRLEKEVLQRGRTIKVREHEIQKTEVELEEDFSENNFILFEGSLIGGGEKWKELSDTAGDSAPSDFQEMSIGFEHRSPLKGYSAGLSINYMSNEGENITFSMLALELSGSYSIINFSLFSIDLFGKLLLSSDTKITTRNGGTSSGAATGYSIGGQFKLFPLSKIGFYGNMEYTTINPLDFDAVNFGGGVSQNFSGFSGVQISAGLSYRI